MSINDIPLGRLKDILASDVPLTIVTTEALIARLEQAEENLESALEANKHWAHRSSRERSELFKAELRAEQAVADYEATTLAVQRVRELALESQAEVAQMNMPNIRTLSGEILRALDGEQS